MRVRRLVLLLVVVAGACGSRRAWHPRPAERGAPSSFAVVSLARPIFAAPRPDATRFTAQPQRDPWELAPFAVLRVLGEENGWVALETVDGDGHCARSIDALSGLRLRLFVPSSGLLPVTQREIAQEFPDGTRIALPRGVPALPMPSPDLYRVHFGPHRAVLRLARIDVATRYLPSAPLPVAPAVASIAPGVLPILGQSGTIETSGAPAHVASLEPVGAEHRVELQTECGRARVRVPSSAVVAYEPPVATPPIDVPSSLEATVGASVFWRDGSTAGSVVAPLRLGAEVAPSGEHRCFAHPVRVSTEADAGAFLELCFAARDVAPPAAGPADRLDLP